MKHIVIVINPEVFMDMHQEKIHLVNAVMGIYIEINNKNPIFNMMEQMCNAKDYLVVTSSEIEDERIRKNLKVLEETNFCEILEVEKLENIPVQYLQRVKILDKMLVSKEEEIEIGGKRIKNQLSRITIQVDGRCRENCWYCGSGYLQFACCWKNKAGGIAAEDAAEIVMDLKGTSVRNVYLVGGELLNYPGLARLLKKIEDSLCVNTTLIMGLKNFLEMAGRSAYLENSGARCVLVGGTEELEMLDECKVRMEKGSCRFEMECVVRSDIELEMIRERQKTDEKISYRACVFYDGTNDDFVGRNGIGRAHRGRGYPQLVQDINRNREINTKHFGHLTVDGGMNVFACRGQKSIGKYRKGKLISNIEIAANKGSCWYWTRDKVEGCKDCCMRYVCDPPGYHTCKIDEKKYCEMRSNRSIVTVEQMERVVFEDR